ncbi:MAG TPA: ribokinase [Geminicoccus sp.]|uniref:ribokinase n=1 Tax=Geminicoccus sp. TaxID=2024832 RepID=UPI002E353CF6|nr:ribokinase [Geminicoccus sp.]HEX2528365.1 ribokinase [Geminicoccus sp.]
MSTLLVLGNAAIDLTLRMERLPVPGESVLTNARQEDIGGKGLNQAVAAHRAGARVRLVAAVGADRDAALIRRSLAKEGISPDDLVSFQGPTDQSIVMLSEAGDNMIITSSDAARSIAPQTATLACAGLGSGDILLVQGNLRQDTTEAAVQQARRRGMRILANPAPLGFDWVPFLPDLDLLIVNAVEAGQIDVNRAARAIITRGADGAELLAGNDNIHVPASAVTALDTTGAGDVLTGVLAAGLWRGMDVEPALRWGMAAASMKVQRRGTISAFPDRTELANLRS